jgi:short-subunit dehydrogenase
MPKTILITGSRSGIGYATAYALARRGHTIIATTHYAADAEKITQQAASENLPITAFALDVTNKADRQKIAKLDIDVLINNAGIGETGSLAEISIAKVRENFEVNLFGPLELTQLALQKMIAKDSGRIIFISSLLGRVTSPFFGSYSMSKFALSSGSEALREELRKISKNIFVSVVEPGAFHTGFNQKMIAKKFAWMDEQSYFFKIKEALRAEEEQRFKQVESRNIDSIVTQIVTAVEAEQPKLRYSAPGWQAFGVQLLRIFGK